MSAALAYQKAVYATIDAAIMPPVYDAPAPIGSAPPYVTIDSVTSEPWDTLDRDGETVTATLSIWTGAETRGKAAALELMGAMRAALHEQPITVAGYAVIITRVDFQDIFLDEDGVSQHGVMRVRSNLRAA